MTDQSRGAPGERGKTGDHGQAGETGETGATGAAGAPAPTLAKRLLVLFIVMMCVFGYLAYRSEINARNIRKNANNIEKSAHQACLDLNDGFRRSNAVIDDEIDRQRAADVPDLSRIQQLQDFKLPIRDCGPRP